VRAPTLDGLLVSDDWDHYAMASGVYPVPLSRFDLFNFVPDNDGARTALRSSGRLPWWSDPQIHLGFLRPLASLLTWSDYAVLHSERAPVRAHWHSIAWWAASVTAVAAVLIRVLPLPAASLGVLLYAVDDALAIPVAWNASRSQLISISLMFWALAAWLDWKRSQRKQSRWLASVLIWLGMLSGEYALSLFAFLVACELADGARPLRERVKTLTWMAVPVALYMVVRAGLGYGARGSAFYFDPIAEPNRYLHALAFNLPLLAGDLTWGYAAENWYGVPAWRAALLDSHIVPASLLTPVWLHVVQLCVGGLGVAAVVVFWRWLARSPERETAHALRWLLAGAGLSLLPLASALPMSRLTAGPSIAVHATFAWITVEAWRHLGSARSIRVRALAVAACCYVAGVHLVWAGLATHTLARGYANNTRLEQQWLVRAPIDDAKLAGAHVFVLSSTDLVTQMSFPFFRRSRGQSVPATSAMLLPTLRASFEVIRPNAYTLELRMFTADALSELRISAYRLAGADFAMSQRYFGPEFQTTVLSAANGLPTSLRFEFQRALDDPSYVFLFPTPDGLSTFSPPPIGGTVRLPPPAWPHPM
jgi:hypothetical protein